MYAIIEEIISCAVPLWNLTLTPLKAQNLTYNRIQYYGTEREHREGDEVDEANEADDNELEAIQRERVTQPEPGTFQPPEDFDEATQTLVDLKRDYSQTGLQVIVKLANIHLTPEKPEYEGGSWHVEGQLVSRLIQF